MKLEVHAESWPIAGAFTISRGSKTNADVVVATVFDEEYKGRGECVPYTRYGESIAQTVAALEAMAPRVEAGLTRDALQKLMPPGAARNALDSALLDHACKATATPAHRLLGLPDPVPAVTAFTLSLADPAAMAEAAGDAGTRPVLKLKLGPDGALERVRAVRKAAPGAALIVDANEAWDIDALVSMTPELASLGVVLIEQPLPSDHDDALAGLRLPVPLCADESVHGLASLEGLRDRYQFVNVKLDKTGGPTEAAQLALKAREQGFGLMIGCMVATSLAMAPAFLLTPLARFVDLDGPLLLARDRDHAIRYDGSLMHPPSPQLWG